MRSAVIAYAGLLAVSAGMLYGQGRLEEVLRFPGLRPTLEHALIGVALAAAVLAVSAASRRWFRWAESLDREFIHLLAPLEPGGALLLAAGSGLAEELFFRVTLQPMLGLWVTSILFGLLHYPMNRRMLAWPFLAAAMGVVFGAVYIWTGSLLAVALAHGTINCVELLGIARSSRR